MGQLLAAVVPPGLDTTPVTLQNSSVDLLSSARTIVLADVPIITASGRVQLAKTGYVKIQRIASTAHSCISV